jgi:hypothetical protein
MSSIHYSFTELKKRHRQIRVKADYPETLSLRVHRALSWVKPAESESDLDMKFILYWIAFNAAYAKALPEDDTSTEKQQMTSFFERLVKLDDEGLIFRAIWSDYSGPIRLLLDNQFIFAPFWKFQQGTISEQDWKMWFSTSRKMVQNALVKQDTVKILSSLFPRIYTLRNQLIHGGATWKSSVNRDQVRDCMRILETLVPVFISLMMEDIHGDWDMPAYPVVSA